MNIVYKREATEDEPKLFKLMEEFILTYLKDKELLNKITLQFIETEDKEKGLSYIGKCQFKPSYPYEPIIKISNYAIRLSANACILSGRYPFYSYEKHRYTVIFHELAHLVRTYNDHELFLSAIKSNKHTFDKEEEDKVNELSNGFLKTKGII